MRRFVFICAVTLIAFACAHAREASAQAVGSSQCAATPSPHPAPVPARTSSRHRQSAAPGSPLDTLASANGAARQSPARSRFQGARQIYTYAPGAIFELYANPGFISTILLEPGETLNEIAAGDTSRWMVTETNAESEVEGRTIILVKPQASNLRTNIVLITDRRTYTIEAVAGAGRAYSAEVAFCYPDAGRAAAASASMAQIYDRYRIRTTRGPPPAWIPSRVFDDGRRTFIQMPAGIASMDLPPLFVITEEGAELVNYRVQAGRYVVDRLFDVAELRLGTHAPTIVRIARRGGHGHAQHAGRS